MIRVSQDKLDKIISSYIENGIPFQYRVTNSRQEIKSLSGSYMNKESQFPVKELNFIKQVKAKIIKHKLFETIPIKYKTSKYKNQINYYLYNPSIKRGDIFNNILEIDMNSAYWNMLFQSGLISPELFKKGETVSKKSRLAAVGSLARTTEVYEFDGEKQIKLPPEKSTDTEHIWHYICTKIGLIMKEAAEACGEGFIFMWVDAIFVKPECEEIVKQIFANYGFESSIEKCNYVQFGKSKLKVKGKGKWIKKDGKDFYSTIREFPFKPKSEASIFNGIKNI